MQGDRFLEEGKDVGNLGGTDRLFFIQRHTQIHSGDRVWFLVLQKSGLVERRSMRHRVRETGLLSSPGDDGLSCPRLLLPLYRCALSASFMSGSQSLAVNMMMILLRGAVAAISELLPRRSCPAPIDQEPRRLGSAPAPCQARRGHFLPHGKPASWCALQYNTNGFTDSFRCRRRQEFAAASF